MQEIRRGLFTGVSFKVILLFFVDSSICYRPVRREQLKDFLYERGLWRTFFQPKAFHDGLLNRHPFLLCTDVDIYIHMNNLLYGSSNNGSIERKISTFALKSSGTRTPASTSKVLRWKDLETAAVAEAAIIDGPGEDISVQSVFSTDERRHDVINGDEWWEDEPFEVEELFV
jgi:hypothetical protein